MTRKSRKLIRIRVSEEQFQALQAAAQQAGARSVGDLALQTMHQLTELPADQLLTDESSYLWTKELTSRLASLQDEVERLELLLNLK